MCKRRVLTPRKNKKSVKPCDNEALYMNKLIQNKIVGQVLQLKLCLFRYYQNPN